jgi:hypothetical protein
MGTGRLVRPPETTQIVLPRIGFVKTGRKNPSTGYPESTDYFIPTGKYTSYFTSAYGEKANLIQVVFFDENLNVSCNERYELRDADGRLFASGDGEDFKVWTGKAYEEYKASTTPDLMTRACAASKSKKGWEVMLTLRFILPKVRGIAGYWEYNTRGNLSSIPSIRGAFDTVQSNRGFIRGIIFDLSVEFAKSQKPGAKSRYPVVTLMANESEENIKLVKESFIKVQNQLTSGT